MTVEQHTTERMPLVSGEEVRKLVHIPANPDGPLAGLAGAPVPNVLGILGNHPDLLTVTNPLLGTLARGTLSRRDRELAVLRVAYHLRSAYQWAHHVTVGTKAGITAEEIARVAEGPDAAGWSTHDAALLRAVDELREPQARVTDETWQQLSASYDKRQLLELLTVIGAYTMLAFVLNSCDVTVEDWYADPPALPEHPAQ